MLTTSGAGLATYSKAANGYIKFANGIIIQWGRSSFSNGRTPIEITLPQSYTNATSYSVTASCETATYSGDVSYGNCAAQPLSANKVKFYNDRNTAYPEYFRWIAIGY